MQLSFEQHGDVYVVRVKEAKLTYPALSPFFAEVRRIVELGARKLVVDLEAVTYLDSPSIGCLIDIHRLLKDRDGSVKLSGPKPRVLTMLSMVLVHRILDIYGDEAEALAAFAASQDGNPGLPPDSARAASRARSEEQGAARRTRNSTRGRRT